MAYLEENVSGEIRKTKKDMEKKKKEKKKEKRSPAAKLPGYCAFTI